MNNKMEIRDLCKQFDAPLGVLNHVSFNVHEGEFLSILGPSGCGKTTMLRILIGLLPPTSGKILKDGKDITNQKPSQRGMGIVFQNYALFENMSAKENVAYALRLREGPTRANKEAEEMLVLVGLSEEMDKKPNSLSGGQQQRVAIARTLVTHPDVMLFDEPMSALDVDTRLSLRGELKNLQKRFRTTMIYITHDQEEAFALSDRILVMESGHIQQIGTPMDIIDHPANEYVERFVKKNIQIKIDSLMPFSRKV